MTFLVFRELHVHVSHDILVVPTAEECSKTGQHSYTDAPLLIIIWFSQQRVLCGNADRREASLVPRRA